MTKKIYLMLLSMLLSVIYLSAQVVQAVNVPTAGGLATAIGSNLKTVTDLTLTGTINATDFNTIKQMTALKNLDMSKVAVVDNAIPESAFAGRTMDLVILPQTLTILSDKLFNGFIGSVELPNGLISFGFQVFKSSTLKSPLVLPSKLKQIGGGAFAYATVYPLDFSNCLDLESIDYESFWDLNQIGSNILDFSKNSKLIGFAEGTFRRFSGHVMLPKDMTVLPDGTFSGFIGSVDLPKGLIKLGARSFESSSLNSPLVIPSTVESIGFQCFKYSQFKHSFVLPPRLKQIGGGAFAYATVYSLDFSNCLDLESIDYESFWDLNQIGSNILDFSKNSKLIGFAEGTFRRFSGHVILPANMTVLPDGTFSGFIGSVDLPKGLIKLGARSFESSSLNSPLVLPSTVESIGFQCFKYSQFKHSFVLPSKLKQIGGGAFAYATVYPLDFSNCLDLESIDYDAFWDLNQTGSNILDFSKNSKLIGFAEGTFRRFSGHVILPANMTVLPDGTFSQFTGTVSLPQGLKTIGSQAFAGAKITSIELPSTVISIGANAFNGASQLSKIISNNPTPPTLGANVFYGVNKETTALEVPSSSINLYGTAAQWKDFLNIKVGVPSKLDLTYKINSALWKPIGDPNSPDIIANYKAVRIGEYYWMNTNFNHVEPYRYYPRDINGVKDTVIGSGIETKFPLTQHRLNLGLDRTFIDTLQYQFDIAEFSKIYGVYYSLYTIDYMRWQGHIYENNSIERNKEWNFPSVVDFRQLVGMSAFRSSSTQLTSQDIAASLVAPMYSNSMISRDVYDKYGANLMYWYYYASVGGNPYNFNFMIGGDLQNEVAPPGDHVYLAYDVDKKIYQDYYALTGDIRQLFNRGELAAIDGSFSLHETVDTRQVGYHAEAQTAHWLPARWCRLLTDEELGYKLYIKIDNIDKSSKEWIDLSQNNYEITLLNTMRNNNISTDYTSIVKLGLNEVAPEGYIELPHGYIRGFYVQYILDQPNTKVTVSDIMKYAYNVEDYVLDMGGDNHSRVPGSSIPGYVAPKTKSLVSEEVVVPFKTDASVTLYPNPVQDVLNISGDGVEKVTIYDMSGRQVSTAKNVNSLSVSDLSKGTYLVRILTANGESTHKVIKK